MSGLLVGFAWLFFSAAFAVDVKSCDDAGISLSSISGPAASNFRSLSNDTVLLMNTDTNGEPAACSQGAAITIQRRDMPSTDCFYVGCFPSISRVRNARVTYDENLGLLVEMKTGDYGPKGATTPSKPLNLRVNQKDYTVKIE